MMGRDKRTKLLWPLVIHAALWTSWLERNRRIFEDREESLSNLLDSIYYQVALLASLHKGSKPNSIFGLVEALGYCIVTITAFVILPCTWFV